MAIDNDLSTPRLEVRFIIGDNDGSLISDQTIDALLVVNSNNVNKTALDAIRAIIADLAKRIDEEVGDIEIEYSQQYRQYTQLYDKLTKDPSAALNTALHFFGGTSKTEADRVNNNSDSRRIKIKKGFGTDVEQCIRDLNDPFSLDCD